MSAIHAGVRERFLLPQGAIILAISSNHLRTSVLRKRAFGRISNAAWRTTNQWTGERF